MWEVENRTKWRQNRECDRLQQADSDNVFSVFSRKSMAPNRFLYVGQTAFQYHSFALFNK